MATDSRIRPSSILLATLSLLGLLMLAWISLARQRGDATSVIVTDFVNDWAAAHLMREHALATLFDMTAYNDALAARLGFSLGYHVWSYPPHLLTLLWPFAYMSYGAGLIVWSIVGLLAYGWVIHRAAPALPPVGRWLALSAPACLTNLLHGQTGFFCAAFLLGGLYLLKRRPWLAGVLFGLLTLKPHLGILIAPMLVLLWQWRAILAAGLTSGALVGLSVLQWGVAPWQAYLTTTREAQLSLLNTYHGFYKFMMPGVIPAGRLLGLDEATAWAIYAVVAVGVVVLVLWMVRREGVNARTTLALALGTLLVTPYSFNYDMTAMSLALIVYLYAPGARTVGHIVVFYLLWSAPALVYPLNALEIPLVPLLLLLGLLLLGWESALARTRVPPSLP